MLDLLGGLPVLDLCDHRGELASWLLARLGAHVVKVEPPGGCSSRLEGPWLNRAGDSLQFEAYNHDKRSIVLDPADPDAGRILRDLIATSAIVFDTGPVGRLASYGLDASSIEALDRPVVYVQITPFGADGPRANQPSSELTIAALGGPVRIQGSPDAAPVPVSVPQVWRHASAEAAVAALIGRAVSVATGVPRIVDVSAQSAMTWTMLNAMEAAQIQGRDFERTGAMLELAMTVNLRHPAADGYVVLVPRGPNIVGLLPAMLADGIVDESWNHEDWDSWDQRIIDGRPTSFDMAAVEDAIDRFCRQYTKDLLLEKGHELGVTIAPINTTADLADFEHLQARGYWADRPSGAGPGMFLTADGSRGRPLGTVPGVGQHTAEVLGRLEEQKLQPSSPSAPTVVASRLPFDGLRVADFSWIGVGPITSKCLADHGATVVRVESANRIDGLRVQPPFKDGEFGLNRSNFFGPFNTSKLGLSVDLKNDQGRRVARRLVEWADVVIDSFTPGVMAGLGLGPEQIREVNPSVITVTTSLLGSGGPYSRMAGYGYHAAALAGFFNLVGYPDGPPEGPWLAYTDTIGPRFITPALLAAIERRDRTGAGCHIEAAQLEIALQFLAPELLAFADHGEVATRMGSRDARFAPQGVYPCRRDGDREGDCWAAITVADHDEFVRLTTEIGRTDLSTDPSLSTLEGRWARHDELDEAISAWTAHRREEEVEARLCQLGIAAAKVQRSSDLAVDPQYRHRDFYRMLTHSEVGSIPYAGHQYRISGYESLKQQDGLDGRGNGPRFAAPLLGEHTFEVLSDLLGFDTEEIAEIAVSGALE